MKSPVPILMYHEIAAASATTSRLAVEPDAFAGQLAHLHNQGFTTMTAAGLAATLADPALPLPDRPIVLTFDDGFADFQDAALPLLQRYGFTGTLFVTTGWIQDAGPWSSGSRPGRMLSWKQIAEAADVGIEIGAHSHKHPELDQLPNRHVREELRTSKAQLEDRLGRAVPGMAYPFGYSSARVRQVVHDLGYQYACAVGNAIVGPAADPLALPRLTVRRTTGLTLFDRIIHGSHLPVIFLKDRSLTRGWAMVRRTRATVGGVSRGA